MCFSQSNARPKTQREVSEPGPPARAGSILWHTPKCLLANYPDATDAYIALGIANYIIGSQNAGARFALWFDGIHGDKKLGMEQVAKTAENGRYLRPFAKIILALAARREKQAPLAQRLLRELIEQYPDSELYASEYAKVSSLPVPVALAH